MTKIIKFVQPTYLKQFHCIGGACEDSCCIGWDVDIDHITYRQYFRTKDTAMKEQFKTYVFKNENAYSDVVDYGKVRLGASKHCPFLDAEGLCQIYSNLGESYLSNVCTSFPRVTNAVDDFYEVSLYLSCPEAARLILLNPNGLEFEEFFQPPNKMVLGSIVDTRLAEYQQTPIQYFKEIREKSIAMMQNRKHTLLERLLNLGYFLETLEEQSEISHHSMVSYLNAYNVDDTFLSTHLSTNYPLLIRLFQKWIKNLKVTTDIDSEKFVAYTKRVQEAFSMEDPSDIHTQATLMNNAMVEFTHPFMETHGYIFENDLVNRMFRNVFPFSQTHCMFDGYMMLIVHFVWIRFYLTGVFLHNKKASVEDAVQLIQVLAKTLDHHKTFLEDLFHEIKENEYDHMQFVKALL